MLCADADAKFNATGAAAKAFRVLNTRAPVFFALFAGGPQHPIALATSPSLSFANPAEPVQIHLALTGRLDEMLVQWTSADPEPQFVRWTITPGEAKDITAVPQNATSQTTTFTRDDLCGSPANFEGWFEPGFFHRARITGLQPGQAVFYAVGSDTVTWSREFSFRAPVHPGATESVRVLVTADVGATEPDSASTQWSEPLADQEADSATTLAHLAEALPADVVLHIGILLSVFLFAVEVEELAKQQQQKN
jgi:hypothetical protein